MTILAARWSTFRDWPNLVDCLSSLARDDSPVLLFESAVEAVVGGETAALDRLLRAHPDLVTARSTIVTPSEPPQHRATLLHYVAAAWPSRPLDAAAPGGLVRPDRNGPLAGRAPRPDSLSATPCGTARRSAGRSLAGGTLSQSTFDGRARRHTELRSVVLLRDAATERWWRWSDVNQVDRLPGVRVPRCNAGRAAG